MDADKLKSQIIKHEGMRLFPYKDTVDKLTIGVGRNLDDRGISTTEALYLLANDLKIAERDARSLIPSFQFLDDVRQRVLVDMSFNLGLYRLGKFKRMLAAVAERDYAQAAIEMLDSKWADQVGKRAKRLARMMATGRE